MQNKLFLSEIDKKYQELLETLSPEQEEVITEYCNAIFSSGADTEEFFYRLGLKDGLNLIIPGLFEPPVRTLRATIPENESHIFR